MGYSTTLYVLDLDELRSAVGSKDHQLIERVRKAEASRIRKSGMIQVEDDPTKCPRVRVPRDGGIFLNGQPMSWDEFEAAIVQPKWRKTTLYLYVEGGDGKKPGKFADLGTFLEAIEPLQEKAEILAVTCLDHDPEELLGAKRKFTKLDALVELVDGAVLRSQPEDAYQYGYALEDLCGVLGKRLEDVCDLGDLELHTPLENLRAPVPLPRFQDFPVISFLTADETEREVKRLGELDLSHSDEDIEELRKSFYRWLQKAARQKKAVVSFYY